ncbi:MAG: hypothetical protein LAT66_03085 [Alkalimonas sp.]|nr:hypothetical protein [Alkalimonas sp.]
MAIHNLGFPRIGKQRELKRALKAFRQHDISHLWATVHSIRPYLV